jgi:site-specific recombinase XerD
MVKPATRVSMVLMTGPLAPFGDAYRLELERRRYTPLSCVHQLRQVGRLSGWLDVRGLAAAGLTAERVDEFMAFQRAGGRHRGGWSRPGLVCLLELLGNLGVLAAAVEVTPPVSPDERLLELFERYLLVERGLVTGTVHGYVSHARRFLAGLDEAGGLGAVTAGEVTAAVLARSVSVSVSATQNFVAGLKSFLRFCFVEGVVDVDLSQAALAMTGRRRSSLPRGISRSDAAALLDSCDRRTALGRRDFALIILLLRLGLRRAEVAGLCLDDIDWRAGELVVRGKGRRLDRLPLPPEVGEAIAAYLRRGRPVTDRRDVFLQARAPFEPIAAGTVASTVRRACRRAGIAEVGSHRLRHTMACDMVAANVPLVEIGEVLRHRSLQSTAIYARVDLEQLRQLAAPWPLSGAPR